VKFSDTAVHADDSEIVYFTSAPLAVEVISGQDAGWEL
jgi:hypothetical protein